MIRLVPTTSGLTMDDLEDLAFRYGGELVRDVPSNTVRLVGAIVDGRRVNSIGPVALDGAA